MSLSFITFSCLFAFCIAEPTWTTLRVTWGKNPFSSYNFAKMPLTIGETSDKGFIKLQGECNEGDFYGHRYIKGDDPATILIYDSKGYIAGIQTGIPAYFINQINTTYPYTKNGWFQLGKIDDKDVYFLTTYFMDPRTICESNRTHDEFDKNIGRGLWFQQGPMSSQNFMNVPLYQANLSNTKWMKGKCFPSMGKHYWYDTSEDMNCDKTFPFFLLFNRNKLTGFGFFVLGNFQFTNRYEHPTKDVFTKFLEPVPKCLYDFYDKSGGLTTFHIYFTVNPWNLFC